MLHEIPDSALRARLLEVVGMQEQLMNALCALPEGSVVDQPWLRAQWPAVPAEWVQRFWENDNGNRAIWIAAIAASSTAHKQAVRNLLEEQLRFAELYQNPPTIRLTEQDWASGAFDATNKLLKSFYAPLFYKNEGYSNGVGEHFHKDNFIEAIYPRVTVCPYTDNVIQDTKLDHFLPKDYFPMLSCHPDNLIPCCNDANSGTHKGTRPPLDMDALDQASAWFHPRMRSAQGTYMLVFVPGPTAQPQIRFMANEPEDQPRLDNMDAMFGLNEFWGRILDDEVQMLASDVQGTLSYSRTAVSENTVRAEVLQQARRTRNRIGVDGLAIVKSSFYEHIAATPSLLDQVVRICTQGT